MEIKGCLNLLSYGWNFYYMKCNKPTNIKRYGPNVIIREKKNIGKSQCLIKGDLVVCAENGWYGAMQSPCKEEQKGQWVMAC